MEYFDSKPNATVWRLVLAGIAPLVLLFVYLFVFRWSGRVFTTPGDYIAMMACSLLGAVSMGMQPLRAWLRVVSIVFSIGLCIALFILWRRFSHPVLNDIF